MQDRHHRHNGHHHGHDHHHHHHHHDTPSGYGLRPVSGHNGPAAAQWQALHDHPEHTEGPEADFDLVESAFAESFPAASDPTSFLRLAGVPFVGTAGDGRELRLLRVEYEEATDVGTVTPRLGGESLRIDPLPAAMVSRRKRLNFVYHDGAGLVRLTLGEARALAGEGA